MKNKIAQELINLHLEELEIINEARTTMMEKYEDNFDKMMMINTVFNELITDKIIEIKTLLNDNKKEEL